MSEKTIEITSHRSTSRPFLCQMSKKLHELLGLSNHLNTLNITCGRHTVTCPVVLIEDEDYSLSLTDKISLELCLPPLPIKLQIESLDKASVKIGPIIGVVTEIYTKHTLHFGSIHNFCEELSHYCRRSGCFLYVFSLTMYDKNNMMGYYFDHHTSNWIKAAVPFPDVVHNRIHSRKLEQSKSFLTLTSELIENKTPYFNDRFLNKWEVHQILSASDHLIPYLPASRLLETKRNLEEMLEEKKDIFIKPINGSQGKRIFRVIQQEKDSYLLDYTTFSGEISKEYSQFQALFKALYPRLKREGFLLQETKHLQTYQNRTFDFRILCHKKNQQDWKVSSSIARLSGEQQFVANLARGGSSMHLKELLTNLYGEKESLHLRKLLIELSLEIVEVICVQAGGEFGEFGVDLALDIEGKPWIIEVNTKPSKSEDDPKKGKVRPSAKSIIHYCTFLYSQI
ncbi:YheC/YheD family endospore coat-associated protein [Bacillus weihaiensis]|uniref:YheC/YheD family endospore coat-associated protein n=1 Tax=Bacillus weihaiensis TaxID=1547283 RepID=UPI0023574CBF|nr:YheC/YheD family protein [Bacillus weihaiensis]